MNRNELIASVAGSAGISKADAASAIDSVLGTISNTLAAGEEVRLVGVRSALPIGPHRSVVTRELEKQYRLLLLQGLNLRQVKH